MQQTKNDFCWTTVQAKEIKPGNLITKLLAKTPRLISNVIIEDNVVTLYVTDDLNERVYIKITSEHEFDLLIHNSTGVPVTEGELYE